MGNKIDSSTSEITQDYRKGPRTRKQHDCIVVAIQNPSVNQKKKL